VTRFEEDQDAQYQRMKMAAKEAMGKAIRIKDGRVLYVGD
jgi:hypothetical protein